MRVTKKENCENCILKCDIYFTAKEMNIVQELEPVYAIYKKHEIICKQHHTVTHAIIMLNGFAKMYIEGINRRNIILYILVPSNYIGLLAVFETPQYTYSVSALNECNTCQIDLDFVKKLYLSNHNFLLKLNKAFGMTVNSIMQKLIFLNQKQIRGRVADSLLYLSQLYDTTKIPSGITRKDIGELSAISEENTVRMLSEFKNEGIIDIKGKEIELIDLVLLKQLSQRG